MKLMRPGWIPGWRRSLAAKLARWKSARKHDLNRAFVILLSLSHALTGMVGYASDGNQVAGYKVEYLPVDLGYIQPTCSKCPRIVFRRIYAATDIVYGVLELEYHDDSIASFSGEIKLTFVLLDGGEHTVTIEDVTLEQGQVADWIVEGPLGWRLEDAGIVWVELVPSTAEGGQ